MIKGSCKRVRRMIEAACPLKQLSEKDLDLI